MPKKGKLTLVGKKSKPKATKAPPDQETVRAEQIKAFFKAHPTLDSYQRKFLTAYRDNRNISASCMAATISRETFYSWKEARPDFKKAYDDLEKEIDDEMLALWSFHGRADWKACLAWIEKREKQGLGGSTEKKRFVVEIIPQSTKDEYE